MSDEKQKHPTTTLITIIISVVQLAVVIFYLAWQIPNKEDIVRVEQLIEKLDNRLTNRIEALDERFDTKMTVLGQNYINHLSIHHVVSSPQE